jgi:hypothetical protein
MEGMAVMDNHSASPDEEAFMRGFLNMLDKMDEDRRERFLDGLERRLNASDAADQCREV